MPWEPTAEEEETSERETKQWIEREHEKARRAEEAARAAEIESAKQETILEENLKQNAIKRAARINVSIRPEVITGIGVLYDDASLEWRVCYIPKSSLEQEVCRVRYAVERASTRGPILSIKLKNSVEGIDHVLWPSQNFEGIMAVVRLLEENKVPTVIVDGFGNVHSVTLVFNLKR